MKLPGRLKRRMRRKRSAKGRAGAALVEMAICLPIIVTTITAVVSLTSVLYLKQTMKIACYEACRVGTVPQAETENVHQQVVNILDGRGVKDYTIDISPSNISSLGPGEFVTVSVTVQTGNNVPMASFFAPATMVQSVSMMSEL